MKKRGPAPLYARVREILESARAGVARSVNTTQVIANWLIGREIVEEEQRGRSRADYGEELILDLAGRLTADYGKGYSKDNLFWFRRFYQGYADLVEVKVDATRQRSDAPPRKSTTRNLRDAVPPILHTLRGESEKKGHAVRSLSFHSIPHAVSAKSWGPGRLHPNLSWTRYRTLLCVDKREARAFFEIEALKNSWSKAELKAELRRELRLLRREEPAP